jgi:hypothetical protein
MSGMGMTSAQRVALTAVVNHIATCGSAPSIRVLASELDCSPTNARHLIGSLVERGQLERAAGGGIQLPASLAAPLVQRLAAFCRDHGESFAAVLHDAVAIHLDQLEGNPEWTAIAAEMVSE